MFSPNRFEIVNGTHQFWCYTHGTPWVLVLSFQSFVGRMLSEFVFCKVMNFFLLLICNLETSRLWFTKGLEGPFILSNGNISFIAILQEVKMSMDLIRGRYMRLKCYAWVTWVEKLESYNLNKLTVIGMIVSYVA